MVLAICLIRKWLFISLEFCFLLSDVFIES